MLGYGNQPVIFTPYNTGGSLRVAEKEQIMKRSVYIAISVVVMICSLVFIYSQYRGRITSSVPLASSDQATPQTQPASEIRSFTVADIAKTGRPQFLNAYATWCPYCQKNEPVVSAVRQQFKDRVDFINLNVDGEGILDAAAPYTITGVTQYVLIDSQGTIIEKWLGTITEDSISASIAAYLASM
jgi:thiol:disulfide interchange protein